MAEEKKSPGSSDGSENDESQQEKPADLDSLQKIIADQTKIMGDQTKAILALNTRLEAMEKHQDTTDTAIIAVAKKVGSGGGRGGLGGILAELAPYLAPRGGGAIEKIAMKSFLENMAFSTLMTRRLARRQFGKEYTAMVTEMEQDLEQAGQGKEIE